MKSGYQTSEFYVTIISVIVGLLVSTGVIVPTSATSLNSALVTIIGGLITIIPAVIYILNRTWLKTKSPETPAVPTKV